MKLKIKRKSKPVSNPVSIAKVSAGERQRIIKLMKNRLDYLTESQVQELEQNIFTATEDYATKNGTPVNFDNRIFLKLYQANVRHYLNNLDDASYIKNNYLKQQIVDGKIKTCNITKLDNKLLFPERWKDYTSKEEDEFNDIAMGNKKLVSTNIFNCGKCKASRAVYYQSQDRSCDEGVTNHVTCLNCGNEWAQAN